MATETDAPNEVVLRRSVVGDELRPAGGGDALGAGEDIFFETAAADGAKTFAGGGDEETGAGAPVRGAGDGDEGGEDGGPAIGSGEVGDDGSQLRHGELARGAEPTLINRSIALRRLGGRGADFHAALQRVHVAGQEALDPTIKF